MAHAGFIWGMGTVTDIIGKIENIMLDLTICTIKHVALGFCKKYGAHRVTVGTDGPFAAYSIKMRIIDDIFTNPEEKQLVLGGNLAKYLGIPKIEE